MKSFMSITGILAWSGGNEVKYFMGNEKSPYVFVKGLHNYFSWDGTKFVLVMYSSFDLGEKKQ